MKYYFIREAVRQAALEYHVKRVELFGSYANGTADAESDVDFLVEFNEKPTSLLQICGFQETVSELLGLKVDIVQMSSSFLHELVSSFYHGAVSRNLH